MTKNYFFKIILWQNPYTTQGVSTKIIRLLQSLDYDIYICDHVEDVQKTLQLYYISLIIVDLDYLHNQDFLKDMNIITLIHKGDLEQFHKIIYLYNNIDYFIKPVDEQLLITRINFFLQNKKETIHILKNNLITYLWKTKLYQEEKLHNLIWKNDYNHYLLTKSSQFIIFFTNILCLVENFFCYQNISFEILLKKIITTISLQMCFFNCFITINIENKNFPSIWGDYSQHFFLFLILLGELCKNNNISTEVSLNFMKLTNTYVVYMELPINMQNIVMSYNDMYIDTNNLFHYLQQYLWQHWKKKIHLQVKSDKIILIEILLQNNHAKKQNT